MKLLFKNEFAWDGLYWIEDEANVEKYYIDARLSENSRNIYVFDPEHKEVGAIRQKALALKRNTVFIITISKRAALTGYCLCMIMTIWSATKTGW